jgi:hypothetical protein
MALSGMDEMHLLCRGLTKLLWEMMTEPKAFTMGKKLYPFSFGDGVNIKEVVGKFMDKSRPLVPPYTAGSFTNINKGKHHFRFVEWEDVLLYVLPICAFPLIKANGARKALFRLSEAVGIAMSYNGDREMYARMK